MLRKITVNVMKISIQVKQKSSYKIYQCIAFKKKNVLLLIFYIVLIKIQLNFNGKSTVLYVHIEFDNSLTVADLTFY